MLFETIELHMCNIICDIILYILCVILIDIVTCHVYYDCIFCVLRDNALYIVLVSIFVCLCNHCKYHAIGVE